MAELALPPVLQYHHPDVDCACLPTLEAYGISRQSAALFVTIENITYNYSTRYGQAACAAHDFDTQPDCTSKWANNTCGFKALGFCSNRWCYVNGSSCSVQSEPTGSVGFLIGGLHNPQNTLHYSYAACGACDEYTRPAKPPYPPPPIAPPSPSSLAERATESISDYIPLISVGVLCLLLACCALVTFLLRQQKRHRHTLKEASRARLIYIGTNKMAVPHALEGDEFHIFLSHVSH